jgi:hypothetical protein
MAGIATKKTAESAVLEVLTVPKEGSVRKGRNGDLVFDPGQDFTDLVPGETRVVDFEYLRTAGSGSNIGTATVIVRAELLGPIVAGIDFRDTRTVSHRIALEPSASLAYNSQCRILHHPADGRVIVGGDGDLVFHPLHDFDDLTNGEMRNVRFECQVSEPDHTRTYGVELTIKAGLHGVFVSDVAVSGQDEGCPRFKLGPTSSSIPAAD